MGLCSFLPRHSNGLARRSLSWRASLAVRVLFLMHCFQCCPDCHIVGIMMASGYHRCAKECLFQDKVSFDCFLFRSTFITCSSKAPGTRFDQPSKILLGSVWHSLCQYQYDNSQLRLRLNCSSIFHSATINRVHYKSFFFVA